MKVLLGGVVGAVLGAIIIAAAAANGFDALWVALPVSVVCGLCVGMIAKQQSNMYVRGAAAALALMLAVIGGKLGAVAFLNGQNQTSVLGAAEPVAPAVAADDEPAPGVESPAADVEEDVRQAPTLTRLPSQPMPAMDSLTASDYSLTDGIWLAVSALVAYQLGKGHQNAAATPVTEASSSEPSATTASE